jgi:hypothetical protein
MENSMKLWVSVTAANLDPFASMLLENMLEMKF